MKQIITIQHTQSVHHTNGMVGSWTDWRLTDLGRTQAERIAQRLLPQLAGKRWTLYSSDLLRAQETAAPLARLLGVTPILSPALRERNLGPAVGKSVRWLRENLEMQERTVEDRLFREAESRRDAWNRLAPFFEEIMASEDENIILVSHGDLLSIFNVMWLGLPVEAMNGLDLFGMAGGVSFLHVAEDRADPGTKMEVRQSLTNAAHCLQWASVASTAPSGAGMAGMGKRAIRRLSDMSFVAE